MSDWQAGDIALCVKGGHFKYSRSDVQCPEAGRFYTVERVGHADFIEGYLPALWLVDGPYNVTGKVWPQFRFVKVTPPEADEFDKETIELYNKKEKPADAKPKRVTTTV